MLFRLNDINGAVTEMLKQRPQETLHDKTAAANRVKRHGDAATKSATQNLPTYTENQNQNENATNTNGRERIIKSN